MHRQERDDVLVKGAIVIELVGQVKDDVGPKGLVFLREKIEVVEDCEMSRRVIQFVQGFQHARFGLAIFSFQFLAQILVDGGRGHGIEQRENFELLLHLPLFRPFKLAGKEIIHHQRRDIGRYLQVQL